MRYFIGCDPSLSNWAIIYASLNEENKLAILDSITVKTSQKEQYKFKNKNDVVRVIDLIGGIFEFLDNKTIELLFIETPVGSQSSRAMFSYGVCIAIEALLSFNCMVKPTRVSDTYNRVNKPNSKSNTIDYVHKLFPSLLKTNKEGNPLKNQEHLADAVCSLLNGLDAEGIKYEIDSKQS